MDLQEGYFKGIETDDEQQADIEVALEDPSKFDIVIDYQFQPVTETISEERQDKTVSSITSILERYKFITGISKFVITTEDANGSPNSGRLIPHWKFGVNVTKISPESVFIPLFVSFSVLNYDTHTSYYYPTVATVQVGGMKYHFNQYMSLWSSYFQTSFDNTTKTSTYNMSSHQMSKFEDTLKTLMDITGYDCRYIFNMLERLFYGATPQYALVKYFTGDKQKVITNPEVIKALNTLDATYMDFNEHQRKSTKNEHRFARLMTDKLGSGYGLRSIDPVMNSDLWNLMTKQTPVRWRYSVRPKTFYILGDLGSFYLEDINTPYTGELVIVYEADKDSFAMEMYKNFRLDPVSDEYGTILRFIRDGFTNFKL